jgi:ABC-type glycerol-3-phosphate transport system substrate-binding protein
VFMKVRNTRRRLFLILVVALGLSAGWALAASAATTLTVWVGDSDARYREYLTVARLFEEQNPDIKVDVQHQAGSQIEVMQKLMVAIAAGAPPDGSGMEGSAVIEYALQGVLTDLTDVISDIRFTPADVVEMTWNGRMWGVPYHTAVRGLFKRIDLFENTGLNPYVDPQTMEEMYAWSQKLTKANDANTLIQYGVVPWSGNWGPPGWIWTFGGQLIETVGNQIVPTADHPKNIEAFEWARSYVELYNRRPFVAGGFQSGGHAMTPGSSTQVAGFLDAGVQFTTGRVPHPPGGQNGTWGGGTAVVVPYNVPNPELSKRLARFFGEAEVQIERYWNGGVALPANWEALIKVGQSLPREYGPLLEQFPEARPRPPLWNEYYVSLLIPALNQVVSGSVTPQQALSNVQQIMKVRYAELFQ